MLLLIGKVQERTTAGVTPIASAIAWYVTVGERRTSTSRRLKSSVTMHAAWPSSLLPVHFRQCLPHPG